MTTKTLELSFKTTQGNVVKINIQNPVEPVDGQAVQQAMDLIVAKNIFQFKTGEIAAVVDARVVERTTTDVAFA